MSRDKLKMQLHVPPGLQINNINHRSDKESIAFLLTSMKILHTTMFFEPAILKDQYYKWNKNRVFLLTQGIHIYH